MKQIIAVLEFDEQELGPQWLNHDNLKALLYSETKTKKELSGELKMKRVMNGYLLMIHLEKVGN